MYRIFSMDKCCRLYQLGSKGWNRTSGTSFLTLGTARNFLDGDGTPPLPKGQFMQDTYIATVDIAGGILKTFPILKPVVNEGG